MLSWGNKNITVEIPVSGGGGGSSTPPGLTLNPASPNTEYEVPNYTFNGKQVYYQLVGVKTRISTTAYTIASNVDRLISQSLCFQGYSGSTPSGVINYFPYIHTDNSLVVMNMSGNALRIVVQSGAFTGTYLIAGWIFYTKNS